jgi:hypothetical protein
MRTTSLAALIALCALACPERSAADAPPPGQYTLFDLGAGVAVGVSDEGDVAVNSTTFPTTASRRSVRPDGIVVSRPILGVGVASVTLRGMAADGTVVGVSNQHACLVSPQTDQAVSVETGGVGGSEAFDVNGAGTVVGTYSAVGNVTYQGSAATFAGGAATKINTQIGVATAVNAAGKIVGRAAVGDLGPQARGRVMLWSQGSEFDLTGDGSLFAGANDINDGDQIVGFRTTSAGGFPHRRALLVDLVNGAVDLGFLPGGQDSEALAINELGVIVGHAGVAGEFVGPDGEFTGRAVAWYDAATMVDLNTLVDPESPAVAAAVAADPTARYVLKVAVGVNAAGDIACSADFVDGPGVASPRVVLLRAKARGLVVMPSPVDFGRVILGETSRRTVSIRNATDEVVKLKVVPPGLPFKLAGLKKMTLKPGATKTVQISVAPKHAESFSSQMSLVHGADTIPVNVVARGVDGATAVEVSPTSLEFGEVFGTVGKFVTLTNESEVAVRVKVAAPAKPFAVAAKSLQILPNSSAVVEVKCVYAGAGEYSGSVSVTPDVKNAATTTVALHGHGIAALKVIGKSDRKVKVSRDGGGYFPLEKDEYVRVGDRILTSFKASVTLQAPDGSTIEVKPYSLIRVDELNETGKARLFILGEIKANVGGSRSIGSDFNVTTPTSTASIRGTKFSVLYDPVADVSLVSVTEHAVDVTPAEGTLVNVPEGMEAESTGTAVGPVVKIGLAGTPVGAVGRSSAREYVLKVLAKAEDSCGLVPLEDALGVGMVQKPDGAPGWDVTVTTNLGVSLWEVDRRYVKPVDAAAQEIFDRCK